MAPLGWHFATHIWGGYDKGSPLNINHILAGGEELGSETQGARTAGTATWAYLAETALILCLVPPEDLLLLDLFKTSDQDLWQRLADFVGLPPSAVAGFGKFGDE